MLRFHHDDGGRFEWLLGGDCQLHARRIHVANLDLTNPDAPPRTSAMPEGYRSRNADSFQRDYLTFDRSFHC